jgi:hypothetical protein
MVEHQQVDIAHDRLQHVVEVVRHAAGKLAKGHHFLRLRELLLKRLLLGRVDQENQRLGVGAIANGGNKQLS